MEDGKGMILTDCNGLKFALSAVLSTVSQVKVEGPAKAEAIRGISRIQPPVLSLLCVFAANRLKCLSMNNLHVNWRFFNRA